METHITKIDPSTWQKEIAPYQTPDTRQSLIQVFNTLPIYLGLWALMAYSLRYPYWVTLLLAIPAAGFMMRTFIIFHDCGHGSFFKSNSANDVLGFITGVLTFTPYYHWRHSHAIHHATVGDLDRRGTGDVWTLTLDEYRALPTWKKLVYRLVRHPLIMFTVGASAVFLIGQRFASRKFGKRERYSVYWTNLALLVIIAGMSVWMGFKEFWMVQLPITAIGTSIGVWLFYVQHQFQGVYWERHERWDYYAAALKGSSYYQLPGWLQWISGNIGFHHIHHISPRIPNYYLETVHKRVPTFQQVQPLTLKSSLHALRLRLYDEQNRCMVGFA